MAVDGRSKRTMNPLIPTSRPVILASNSPRRRQLLRYILPQFDIAPSRDIDESYPSTLAPEDVPGYISRLKAEAYADLLADPSTLLLTADTIVVIDGHILGKPHSADQACEMLRTLAGRTHHVITGVTLRTSERSVTFADTTAVHFDNLGDDEIRSYVDTYNPMDKAGAYGIQEWIGCRAIKGVEGCFYNVMGLPLSRLFDALRQFDSTDTPQP